MRSRAWAVGVQELSPGFRQAIETHLVESADPQIRVDAAVALGYAEESEASRHALSLILDPNVKTEAVYILLYSQFRNPVTRPAAWTWFNERQSAVAARLPAFNQRFLAELGEGFCSAGERDAFQVALAPRLATVGEIPLRRTLERIDVCTAVRTAHKAELATMERAPQ